MEIDLGNFIFFYSAIYFIEFAAAMHIRELLVEVD